MKLDWQLGLERDRFSPAPDSPWRVITIGRLHRRTSTLGWGRNWAGEYFQGPTVVEYFVRLPDGLVDHYNVEVGYLDQVMVIYQGATPAFRKPLSWDRPDLMAYFGWMTT